MEVMNDIELRIARRSYEEIERIIQHSNQFKTVADYVNFVLDALLFETENVDATQGEDVIKTRLADLGYL